MRLRAAVVAVLLAGCVGEDSLQAPPTAPEDSEASETATLDSETPGDVITDAAEVGAPDYPLPPIPMACPRVVSVFALNPNGGGTLAAAFEANASPCADYLVHVPALAADRTRPRGPEQPAAIRARKGRFFAVAELDFGAWSLRTELTWFDRGVEFRKRMDAAGYNVMRGDTWVIHELPPTVRTDAAVRKEVIDLVRGLYSGPPGSMTSAGVVLVSNVGHETTNFASYKPALRTWLTDSAFFTEMNKFVRLWGQGAHTSASLVCATGATVAARAERVNDFAMHPGRLATGSGAPGSALMARTFFGETYFPLLNAVWKSTAAFGATDVTLDAMKHHVSLQVYATRLWLETHPFPDGRIGFAWDESAGTTAERAELATRLAQSIRDGYAPGATASRACSPSGAYSFCDCSVTGAAFNDAWKTFSTW